MSNETESRDVKLNHKIKFNLFYRVHIKCKMEIAMFKFMVEWLPAGVALLSRKSNKIK